MCAKEKRGELMLSAHLRRAKRNGITQAELSRKTGIAPSVLCEWSAGRVPRDPWAVRGLAHAMGLSMEELLFGGSVLEPIARDQLQSAADRLERELSGILEIEFKVVGRKLLALPGEPTK